ncbi:MAG: YggT family protein, partial [Clostridia bacterium]|nr:YggT family protein [Clostridia bacterium]
MNVAVYIIVETVKKLLGILIILFLIRSVMSWMPGDEESKFSNFITTVTEPVVSPFRLMTEKIQSLQGLPIDLSVFFASLTVMIVYFLL